MFILALISSVAMAAGCPILEGTYKCQNFELTVEQQTLGSDTQYTLKRNGGRAEELIVNEAGVKIGNAFAKCLNNAIVFEDGGMILYHERNSEGAYIISGEMGGVSKTELENCPPVK